MANQERTNEQNQQTQGQDVMRSSQDPQRRGMSRAGSYVGFGPVDLFRLGPFSLMRRMNEEMERVIGEFGMNRGEEAKTAWAPTVEVTQRDGKYVVHAELPGVRPEDVKLEVTDDAVVLQGERKCEHEETKGGVRVSERRYGSFFRAIPLPEGANVNEARARFENGVLEVEVPVAEQRSNRRQIPIEGGSTGQGQGQPGSTERAA
jgi:HSP20 family protein